MKKIALFALVAVMALPVVSVNAMDAGANEIDAKTLKKMIKRGKKVAVKQCYACHDITENKQMKVGPPLWGVFGKAPGHVEGYQYSDAHLGKKDSLVWDEATLDAYVQDPKALIPGNKMVFPMPGAPVMKEKHRKNLIQFLKSLK